MTQPAHHKIVIIGSGPAGYTAALYSARALLQPLLFMGHEPGGQLTITTEVENYPGFVEGVMGPDLVEIMKKQAGRFGTTYVDGAVTSVDLSKRPFTVVGEAMTVTADALIIATGASANWLDIPSVHRFRNKGISACATCDGFFFRGQKLGVVGGGDSAVEEATFLTRYASEVHLLVRRDALRASKIMQERAFANPKLKIRWNTVVDECLGEEKLQAIRLQDTVTGATATEDFGGLFMAIGHTPNSAFLGGQLPATSGGYLLTMPGRAATRIPGVFACGDVVDSYYRQAITAAGTGCAASIEAERFLESGEMPEPPTTWAGAPVHAVEAR
jgi:thioredoxin reductase (NADPH)